MRVVDKASRPLKMLPIETIRRGRQPEQVAEAIGLLRDRAPDEVREAILDRYRELAEDGPRLDRGATVRTALLTGLRGLTRSMDAALAEEACYVYETSATSKWDVAGNLRGAALVLLAELDVNLALFQAARLLVDPATPEMSGQPALTAAQLLRANDQLLALYTFLAGARSRHGELTGEALVAMAGAPDRVARDLAERYRDDGDDAVRAGLYDMLMARPDDPRARTELERLIREGSPDPVFAYVTATIVAARSMDLVAVMRDAEDAGGGLRQRMLREALGLLPA
jgi:hypothetical protein